MLSNSLFCAKLEEDERPAFGPLVFVASPNAFTGFHQDMYGTVDSVHYCHSGCNEVVMLRRLTDAQKKDAMQILFSKSPGDAAASDATTNVLTVLPHSPRSVSLAGCSA